MWRWIQSTALGLIAGSILPTVPAAEAQSLEDALTTRGNPLLAKLCLPQRPLRDDVVDICVECTGAIFVNGDPVSLVGLEANLIRFQSLHHKPKYELRAQTAVHLPTYLEVTTLLERHKINSSFQIKPTSRRALCR